MTRSSTSTASKQGKKAGHIHIKYSGPSFAHLPTNVLENIFLRLSIKRIFVCKSMCKTWYGVISDPEFAKLHFDQAQIWPLIRSSGATFLSRMLYLVNPENDDFEQKLDKCDHGFPKHVCFCDVKVKLDIKLKLPLRKLRVVLNDHEDGIGNRYLLTLERIVERNEVLKLNMKEHNYRVVNSCNGFLCLSNPLNNDPLLLCHPVTGEFTLLPEGERIKYRTKHEIACGFGFSPTTNQYKVIRMLAESFQHGAGFRYNSVKIEVHTIGSIEWKKNGSYCTSECRSYPTYLNWHLYWFSERSVIFFDIDKEYFRSISHPPFENNRNSEVSMGILAGELCISKAEANVLYIWSLKEDGANEEWLTVFSVDLSLILRTLCHGSYQPIKYLNNGASLMFHSRTSTLIYKDPRKLGFKLLKVRGIDSIFEVIQHIPSFRSLKDVLSLPDRWVLNVKSRCGKLKLHNEAKCVTLVEEKILL